MRNRWLHLALAAAALATCAGIVTAADYTDFAPVVATRPVYDRVNVPQQSCWNETVTVDPPPPAPTSSGGNAAAGTIIGGVLGGVAGHQVGSGRGKDVATVAGAVAGALIGNAVATKNSGDPNAVAAAPPPEQRVVQRCQTVDAWQDVLRGYDVTYRYGGRDTTVRLSYDPGAQVRVAVGVVNDGPPLAYGNGAPPPPPR